MQRSIKLMVEILFFMIIEFGVMMIWFDLIQNYVFFMRKATYRTLRVNFYICT